MDGRHALTYLGAFAGAGAISWLLTPLVLRFALRRGVLDEPGGHKGHDTPVPYLGGAAIVLAFAATVTVAGLLRPPGAKLDQLLVILGLAVAVSLVGLLDDLRGVPSWLRLGWEVLAAVGLWSVGVGTGLFPGDAGDIALTVLWVVGITNAFNLLDNMDGLSAGVATIAAVSIGLIAAVNGQFLVGALGFGLAGCAIGFLRHNFHPARIYMGDAGSLFLGFMLAVLGLKLRFDAPREVTFWVPIVALAIPILDTSLVVVSRLRHGRTPFTPGRDHISHRLVAVGLPVPAAVGLVYAAAAALGWSALIVSRVDLVTSRLFAAMLVAAGLFLGWLLSKVPVYDTDDRDDIRLQRVSRTLAETRAE